MRNKTMIKKLAIVRNQLAHWNESFLKNDKMSETDSKKDISDSEDEIMSNSSKQRISNRSDLSKPSK